MVERVNHSASFAQVEGLANAGPFAFARPLQVETLVKRRDFIALSRATRQGTLGMHLQARYRDDGDPRIRVGFTCSKKVGNAVQRNAAKRRLREVARLTLPKIGRSGWDYVLFGRLKNTEARAFDALVNDLKYALKRVHER